MPELFVGVTLYGRDHLAYNRHTDRAMLNVILDFSVKPHDIYPQLPSYRRLVQQLREQTPHKGWRFYDHLEECLANRHHPLISRDTLLDMLRGTTTIEEQRDAIHCTACDVFKLL